MDVTVIIPTYNRAGLIRYSLDSLDAGLHPGVTLEVIVVDDGSTDDTREMIARQYPHVKLLSNKTKGAAAARNVGLAAAAGKYIMFLDSDDLVGPGFFAAKVADLDAHEDHDACYGNYDFFRSDEAFTENSVIFRHKYPVYADGTRYAQEHLINYLGGNFLPPNSIIWRKDFLLRRGGYDEQLPVNQDVELFVRSIFNGLRIIAIKDDSRVLVRNHSLDDRVGDPWNAREKWRHILKLRKRFHTDLRKYSFEVDECYAALSTYLFNYWKLLRHTEPEIALEFLEYAKKVYWPVPVKGGLLYRLLATFVGPEKATNLKYALLKRD